MQQVFIQHKSQLPSATDRTRPMQGSIMWRQKDFGYLDIHIPMSITKCGDASRDVSAVHASHACSSSSIMDFTQLYKQANSLVEFSPGAQWILSAHQDRVIVRRTDTFEITRTWAVDGSPSPTHDLLLSNLVQQKPSPAVQSPADGYISHIGWSCDSEYILAACAKRGFVHLLKLRDGEWNGRIEAGAEGARLSC